MSDKVWIIRHLGLATVRVEYIPLPWQLKDHLPETTAFQHRILLYSPTGHCVLQWQNQLYPLFCIHQRLKHWASWQNVRHAALFFISQELRPVTGFFKIWLHELSGKKKKKNYQEENNRASTPPRNSEYFCIKIGIMMAAYSVSNSAIYCKAIAIILWLREAYLKVHSMPLIKDVPSVHLLQWN